MPEIERERGRLAVSLAAMHFFSTMFPSLGVIVEFDPYFLDGSAKQISMGGNKSYQIVIFHFPFVFGMTIPNPNGAIFESPNFYNLNFCWLMSHHQLRHLQNTFHFPIQGE